MMKEIISFFRKQQFLKGIVKGESEAPKQSC